MEWAALSGAPAAGSGATMLSFASSSTAAASSEARLQDFPAAGLVGQRARPGAAAAAGRRSRAAGGADACSVDGCRSDLSRCREYHRRHRVCEAHSKTPVVVVGGQEQRFCQQCSRFHMLSEFDEEKRSCRKRLDGHNRRRRKPQHDLTNLGGFFPYHQVNQFEIYPQNIPTASQNPDIMHSVDRQPPFSISFSGAFKPPKQFHPTKDGGSMLNTARPGLLIAEGSSHTGGGTWINTPSGTLGPEFALSLLSSSLHHPSPSPSSIHSAGRTEVTYLSHVVTASRAEATALASGGGHHHVFVSDAVFQDPSQALPFPWH